MAAGVRVGISVACPGLLLLATSAAAQGTKLSGFFPPPAFPAGDVADFEPSPDGTRVVYRASQDASNRVELFSRPVDLSLAPVKLNGPLVPNSAGEAEVSDFAISPDGRWVVYSAPQLSSTDDLFVIPIEGGTRAKLLSRGFPEALGFEYWFTPDSRRLVVELKGPLAPQLYSLPLDGDEPAVPLHPPLLGGSKFLRWIEVSPNSSRVLFAFQAGFGGPINAFSAPTAGGSLRFLGEGILDLEVLPDSSAVVYVRNIGLYRAPVDASAPPVQLAAVFQTESTLWLTPDGSRALFRQRAGAGVGIGLYGVPVDGSSAPVELSPALALQRQVLPTVIPAPDGTRVIFAANPTAANRYQLFSAPVDGSSSPIELSPRISAAEGLIDSSVFVVTPDSSRVVYRADAEVPGQNELYSVPIQGGTAVKLNGPLVAGGDVDRSPFLNGSRVIDLSSDGSLVVYRADQEVDQVFELFSVPVDGSAPPVKLNQPFEVWNHTADFRIVHSGEQVVYHAALDQNQVLELYRAEVDGGGEPVRVNGSLAAGPSVADVVEFEVDPSGRFAVFRADVKTDEQFDLYSVRIADPRTLRRLNDPLPPGRDVRSFELSADGRYVVYDVIEPISPFSSDLFVVPVDGSAGARQLDDRDVPGQGRVSQFEIAPDGERVVFIQALNSVFELFAAPVGEGGPPVKLNERLVEGGDVLEFQISPDGTRVAYRADQDVDRVVELYSVPAGGGSVTKLNAPLAGRLVSEFTIAQDGRRVVYVGEQETDGVFELFSAPLDGQEAPIKLSHPVAPDGDVARDFLVSSDGHWVAYVAFDAVIGAGQIYGVPTDGSRDAIVLNAPPPPGGGITPLFGGLRRFRITPDGAHVVYIAEQDTTGQVELYVVPVDGSAVPTKLNAPLAAQGDVYSFVEPFVLGPRGIWVAYRAYEQLGQANELFLVPLDGSREARRVTDLDNRVSPYRFTDDEIQLVFIAADELGTHRLYAAPTNPPEPPQLLSGALTPFGDVLDFRLSPAADRVVYLADQDTDGVDELFMSPLPTSAELLLGKGAR